LAPKIEKMILSEAKSILREGSSSNRTSPTKESAPSTATARSKASPADSGQVPI
jgi:hypothetical protein